jgi:rhodanese-related sulfurtransferase/CBS domain-containing protein
MMGLPASTEKGGKGEMMMVEIAPREINREDVRTLTRRGGQLVEVLPREEYDKAHLAGAVSIPLVMISRNTADRLQWDKPVIVYSSDSLDDLSARAAWRLASMGFTQVYRYVQGKADWLANGLPVEGTEARLAGVGDLADMDVPTCSRTERVGEVRERVRKDGWNLCVVTNEQLVVLGLLSANDLEKADPKWTAEEAMERDPKTFRLNTTFEEAGEWLRSNRRDSVLVTTTDGKLFGLLKLDDLEKAL